MDDGERRGKELVDDELERVRKRLLKVNEKIKQYSNLQKNSRPFDGKEYTPSNDLLGKEIPIEEMHAKLHAINEYVRNRALGKDVAPPVFERPSPPVIKRPAPPLKKLSREIVIEPVPEIGEALEESSEIVADETTTIEIPELMTRGRKEPAARLGVGLDL